MLWATIFGQDLNTGQFSSQLSSILAQNPNLSAISQSDVQTIAQNQTLVAQIYHDAANGSISNSTVSAVSSTVNRSDVDPANLTPSPPSTKNANSCASLYSMVAFVVISFH